MPQGTLSGSVVSQGETGRLTYTSSTNPVGGPFTIVYLPSGGTNVTVTNVTSGVAFNVASGTPSTTTTYSLVSVTDETSTISRTSSFTGTTATINIIVAINYGQVTSAGGRIWLDRNLGASQVATSSTDVNAYGDYYQWGRPADGHQMQHRLNFNNSGVTDVRSSTSVPPNSLWIQSNHASNDWLITPDNTLWTGANPTNNVCPVGFRIPTTGEWDTEKNSWSSQNINGGFASPLKLTMPGMLTSFTNFNQSAWTAKGSYGQYLTQSAYTQNPNIPARLGGAVYFGINSSGTWNDDNYTKMHGMTVRCIMNVTAPTLTSTISSTINSYSAILGGALSSTGGENTSVRIIYSTDVNFTTSSTVTITSTASVGNVTTTITGLTPLTTYYAKAYAVNTAGSTFGSTISFTTSAPPPDGSSASQAAISGVNLKQDYPSKTSGWYWIKSEIMPNALEMYVDMTEEGGGYDFYFITNGPSVNYVNIDNGGTPLGLYLVMPRSQSHWKAMYNAVNSAILAGKVSGNLGDYFQTNYGVYRNTGGTRNYKYLIMRDPNSYGTGAPDWRVKDGGRWWLMNVAHGSEPTGDSFSYALLGSAGINADGTLIYDAYSGIQDQRDLYYTGLKYLVSTNQKQ
jgi:uncharacterized protein (TIGR02145 family)